VEPWALTSIEWHGIVCIIGGTIVVIMCARRGDDVFLHLLPRSGTLNNFFSPFFPICAFLRALALLHLLLLPSFLPWQGVRGTHTHVLYCIHHVAQILNMAHLLYWVLFPFFYGVVFVLGLCLGALGRIECLRAEGVLTGKGTR
jgi:hypothetical protein